VPLTVTHCRSDNRLMANERELQVPVGSVRLAGILTLPDRMVGTVVFVHGSGSSRHSPRNRYVARRLGVAGIATFLFDLLTEDEELDRSNVFRIELLAGRLLEVTNWLMADQDAKLGPLGYFGASTGAAAALWAAATGEIPVAAVVSRGGRPDLALPVLDRVGSPTLLIVGGRDTTVLEMNRAALARLRCEASLKVVPGAGHLFEEPGTLDIVADLAADWFRTHFTLPPTGGGKERHEQQERA
jgi:putative phosphoribosyl transferase